MVEMVDPTDRVLRKKMDMQLTQSDIDANKLAKRLDAAYGPFIELKDETWQWEDTGNIFIECESHGEKSGIAITEAGWWAHELKDRQGNVVITMFIPVVRLKALCRDLFRDGKMVRGGDGNKSKGFKVPVRMLVWLLMKYPGSEI